MKQGITTYIYNLTTVFLKSIQLMKVIGNLSQPYKNNNSVNITAFGLKSDKISSWEIYTLQSHDIAQNIYFRVVPIQFHLKLWH